MTTVVVEAGYMDRPFFIKNITCAHCGTVADYVEKDIIRIFWIGDSTMGLRWFVRCAGRCGKLTDIIDTAIPHIVKNRIKISTTFFQHKNCDCVSIDNVSVEDYNWIVFIESYIIFECPTCKKNIDRLVYGCPNILSYIRNRMRDNKLNSDSS